jgi:hypothetical protein
MMANLNPPGVYTEGGAVVFRDVKVGRDFVGRDQVNQYYNFVTMVFMSQRDEKAREPYVSDRPFRRDEHRLFTGREEAIKRVVELLDDRERRAVVVCGPAGVGKTSLLAAGIVPRLDPEQVNPAMPLRDYGHASPYLRVQLWQRAKDMGLGLPEETPIPELVKAITQASSQRLVLILDQFERFFQSDVSEPERDALRRDLSEAMSAVETRLFQIIIAIRDGAKSNLDQLWGDLLPDLHQRPVYLQPFSREQARQAIQHPIKVLGINPVFVDDFLENQLLPDLERLSSRQPAYVLPADLQIVCGRLFQSAKDGGKTEINDKFYFVETDGKGAEQIIDRRFDDLTALIREDRRDLARRIAATMVDRGSQTWLAPDQLPGDGAGPAEPAEIQNTLGEMGEAGMVIWHVTGGTPPGRKYSLASDSIARAAERALGPEADKRRQARKEVDYVWRDWQVDDDSLASRYQLNLIAENYLAGDDNDRPPPERTLLLLKSAVARQAPVDYWLKQLGTDQARGLIRELEEKQVETGQEAEPSPQSTPQSQARRILALADDKDLPKRPESSKFGAVAWSAAAHRRKAVCRETAALALLAAYCPDALARIEAAVRNGKLGRGRLAELRGILAEANTAMAATLRSQKKPSDRFDVWWWRFRRHLTRDLPYIGSVALGGAVGTSLGLGVLRAVLATSLSETPGYAFYGAFPMGFLFGLAVSLGLLLVNPIRLHPPEHGTASAGRRPLLPAVGLGGLCFFLMEVLHRVLFEQPPLVTQPLVPPLARLRAVGPSFFLMQVLRMVPFSLRALVDKPLIPPLALLAGLGLSLAVYDQPVAGWRLGVRRWLVRLVAVAAVFALVQLAFVLPDPQGRYGTGLVFTWTGFWYQSHLQDTLVQWGLGGILSIPNWYHYVAVIDAGLTGIALAAGLNVGLNLANYLFNKWEELADRAGE